MQRRQFLAVGAASVAAALAGCTTGGSGTGQSDTDGAENDSGGEQSDPPDPDDSPEPEDSGTNETETDDRADDDRTGSGDPAFEVTSHAMVEDDWGDAFVAGDIENVGDGTSGYVEVVAYFYDDAGEPIPGDVGIGNHYAHGTGIDPGGTRVFEIVTWIPYDDVAEYEIVVERAGD